MSIKLEENLINKVKELSKHRELYYEFLIIDNKYQIINHGEGACFISLNMNIDKELIQEIKDEILKDLKKESSYLLELSSKNVVLTSLIKLEESLVTKQERIERRSNSLIEFDKKVVEMGKKFSESESLAYSIYSAKIIDIFVKLLLNLSISSQEQMLNDEFLPIVRLLPDVYQEELLDLFNKM